MAKKVAVLLSGCGVNDGAEIAESVLTLLFLDRAGARILCTAPNIEQMQVINHFSEKVVDERRNVLVESARIARGDIRDLQQLTAADIDALVIPGGFGAAKNLSNFAVKGAAATVDPEVQRILKEMLSAGKPIGAMCIAPATVARALAEYQPEVTIGTDRETAAAIEAMGAKHVACPVDQIHVDIRHKIVTTPAYMLGPGIKDVATGIEKLVNKILELA